jgi:hypothetical protein
LRVVARLTPRLRAAHALLSGPTMVNRASIALCVSLSAIPLLASACSDDAPSAVDASSGDDGGVAPPTNDGGTSVRDEGGASDASPSNNDATTAGGYLGGSINESNELLCNALTACLPELDLSSADCLADFSSARRDARASLKMRFDRGLGAIPPGALECIRNAGDECTTVRQCLGITLVPSSPADILGRCEGQVRVRRGSTGATNTTIRQDCSALGWMCVGDGVCRPADMTSGSGCQNGRYLDDEDVIVCNEACGPGTSGTRCVATTPCVFANHTPTCDGDRVRLCTARGIPYAVDCVAESPTGSGTCDASGAGCSVTGGQACPAPGSTCIGNVIRRCVSIVGAFNPNVYDAFDCGAHGWRCESSSNGARCAP